MSPYTYAQLRALLQTALEHGWEFVAFDALKDQATNTADTRRLCALRHDCDNDLIAAQRMAALEREVGVRSTYFLMTRSAQYNVFAPTNRDLVRSIVAQGHWLGLHFDGASCQGAAARDIGRAVARERRWIEEEFGQPITAVSFHQPASCFLKDEIELEEVSTYDAVLMRHVPYRSDSNLRFLRDGLPTSVICDPTAKRLQLLLHPEWWTEEPLDAAGKWRRMLEHNFALMEGSLADREAIYDVRHDLRVVPATAGRRPP